MKHLVIASLSLLMPSSVFQHAILQPADTMGDTSSLARLGHSPLSRSSFANNFQVQVLNLKSLCFIVKKPPSLFQSSVRRATGKAAAQVFSGPVWGKLGKSTTLMEDILESNSSEVLVWDTHKKNGQRDLDCLKESLALQVTWQPSQKPDLVSTQEADMKLLQLALILTGQERSANPTRLWNMRMNLSGQGKMKSKNYHFYSQPSRRTNSSFLKPAIQLQQALAAFYKEQKIIKGIVSVWTHRTEQREMQEVKPMTYMTLSKKGDQIKSDLKEKLVELPSVLLHGIFKNKQTKNTTT